MKFLTLFGLLLLGSVFGIQFVDSREDENTISVRVESDTTVESYMCDKDTNFYRSDIGPKGLVWSNIEGDWSSSE